jgi:septum formation protein
MSTLPLYLASKSPRRKEILDALGLPFTVCAVDIEEQLQVGESADKMVLRLAAAKVAAADVAEPGLVLGADTAVVVDDAIFGKPADREEGLDMLAKLSGRSHKVLTGVAVRSAAGIVTALSETEVRFRKIGPDEALAYWQSGEPCDKAGAYAIQGRGGVFVESITGSYSGVVGLPVYETARLLSAAGLDISNMQHAIR